MDTNSIFYKRLYPLYEGLVARTKKTDKILDAVWAQAYNDVVRLAKQSEMEGGRIGIYIKALDSGRTISYNKSDVIDIASVRKLVVMAATYSGTEKYPGKFTPQELANIDVLVLRMIGVSDNESCHELVKLLRDKLGDEYFQAYCGEAGLSNTSIKRSSPEDIAFLLENLYKGELFQNQDISRKCVDMLKQQIHNDRIPYCLPARIKKNIAHKTGTDYINENYKGLKIVCHDAGIIYTPKGDFIICVMIEYKVDDGKILKPSTPTAWRWAYTENKMYLLITKGNEIIRRIAMTIYYDCIERRTKPQPVL